MEYLYSQIAKDLEKKIDNGEYGVHQKLPSENELAFQFSTTRLTIRKAIETLEKRHVVVKDRNRGTFVLSPALKISSGSQGLVSFTEAAESRQLKAETILVKLASVSDISNISEQVVKQLMLDQTSELWEVERVRLIDKEPMTHEMIYIQKKFLPELNEKNALGSLFKMIEKNITISYGSQELEAVLLDKNISKMLHVPVNSQAFFAQTTSYSVEGYPILYDESYYRADKYTFHNILYRKH